jgi:hypothetical protein
VNEQARAYPLVSTAGRAHRVGSGRGGRCLAFAACEAGSRPPAMSTLRDLAVEFRSRHASASVGSPAMRRGRAAANNLRKPGELV